MTHDEAMEQLASLLTPEFIAALDDSDVALLRFCEHRRLALTCDACRDAPVPPGMRRRFGTLYGCGDGSCAFCYEPADNGPLSYQHDYIPAPIVSFPAQMVFWRLHPDGDGTYQVRPAPDLPETHMLQIMQNGRILFPCTSALFHVREGQRFDVCVYSRAEDGLPSTLVAYDTLMFHQGDCYHAALRHVHAPFPRLKVLALPMKVE